MGAAAFFLGAVFFLGAAFLGAAFLVVALAVVFFLVVFLTGFFAVVFFLVAVFFLAGAFFLTTFFLGLGFKDCLRKGDEEEEIGECQVVCWNEWEDMSACLSAYLLALGAQLKTRNVTVVCDTNRTQNPTKVKIDRWVGKDSTNGRNKETVEIEVRHGWCKRYYSIGRGIRDNIPCTRP